MEHDPVRKRIRDQLIARLAQVNNSHRPTPQTSGGGAEETTVPQAAELPAPKVHKANADAAAKTEVIRAQLQARHRAMIAGPKPPQTVAVEETHRQPEQQVAENGATEPAAANPTAATTTAGTVQAQADSGTPNGVPGEEDGDASFGKDAADPAPPHPAAAPQPAPAASTAPFDPEVIRAALMARAAQKLASEAPPPDEDAEPHAHESPKTQHWAGGTQVLLIHPAMLAPPEYKLEVRSLTHAQGGKAELERRLTAATRLAPQLPGYAWKWCLDSEESAIMLWPAEKLAERKLTFVGRLSGPGTIDLIRTTLHGLALDLSLHDDRPIKRALDTKVGATELNEWLDRVHEKAHGESLQKLLAEGVTDPDCLEQAGASATTARLKILRSWVPKLYLE
jgi:hypothetical protein